MSMHALKKKVLLVVHTNTWFIEMHNLALLLRDSGRFDPVVHFARIYPTTARDIAKLESEGIAYEIAPLPDSRKWLEFLDRLLGKYSSWPLLVVPAIRTAKNLMISLFEIAHYKNLIRRERAELLVMAGDLVGYNTPEVVSAAHKAGVPCIIVPSTMSDGTEQAEAYFFDESFGLNRKFNRLVAKWWPKWKKLHKGKWLVRLPGEQIIPRELLKISPPLPWVSSSSLADRVAVESSAMWDYYRRCGIAPALLRRTGTLANDVMAKVTKNREPLRRSLIEKLGLNPKKGIILTALPPDFLYMPGGRPECEFPDYLSLVKYWLSVLDGLTHFNTVISLHPSVEAADFRYLETPRVRIATERIVELLPLCDFFTASVSSTIRWAITCSKPVVNYDVYQYHYSDFTAVKGVLFVDKKDNYREVLERIDTNEAYRIHLNLEVSAEAEYWGCLDGAEGERMLSLFDEEIGRYQSVRNQKLRTAKMFSKP